MKLSVLDLVPVSSAQSSADAIAASTAVLVAADRAGFTRYWFAEHHNMPSVASTSPAVLGAAAIAATEKIRIGSGGVMLPNHAPLVVAEQFALLEAMAPGRIDLGLGRAPGSDPVVTAVLTGQGAASGAARFPDHVADILALLDAEGANVRLSSDRPYELHSTPLATARPTVWLLGSSDYSARLAAQLGLPYVFAHHFSATGADAALQAYRGGFTPSEYAAEPRSFITANVVVADTTEEAEARAVPQLQQMARLRSNERLGRLPLVEDALAASLTALQQEMVDRMRDDWIIGDAASVADQLRVRAEYFGVDEVMVSLVAGDRRGEDPRAAAARVRGVELLSELIDAA
ncbi:LLM class flavin-dependent oxidoreductase [Mycetocola reblochoni]|uniref:Coenzyme F420-dependent oxidoreductase n=2 Tax=Mycetocola reblochoni TaxID=331618 RepID=A0A1R4K994_9MICO|nr:LLM class flavin-dependent oxidoreductase [Mycetocola reblochoni]RLP68096.1 LLM class flavin-dependent oxidoreductase [Mycetocola reblochoni]SJN40725.1 Coenzyme F420-dependent oxidoreductase [Mycetocola reblochoni REB411]